jgi:hypothetical protein
MVKGRRRNSHLTAPHFYHSPRAISTLSARRPKQTEQEQVFMSVIGRMDNQVDEIIIKPVGARLRLENEEAQVASPESTPPPPNLSGGDRAPDQEGAAARTEELPVWLL